jgi:hypothetical protein
MSARFRVRRKRAARRLPTAVRTTAPLIHRHPRIDRAQDQAGGNVLQFDIAEFARRARLDAVAQAHELQRASSLGSSALSNTRPGTLVPEAKPRPTTVIRLLRFLRSSPQVRAGKLNTWSVQPLSTAFRPLAISVAIFDKGWLYQY